MATMGRAKVKGYRGIFFIESVSPATGKPDKIYYIRYKRNGKLIEEKAGRASVDGMTAAAANAIRADRMRGKEPTNTERRAAEREIRERWTIDRLWEEWKKANADKKSLYRDDVRYKKHLRPIFGSMEAAEVTPLGVDRLRIFLLKGKVPHAPGRAWNPEAKRRKDESAEKRKAGAERSAKRMEAKPYAVSTVVSIMSLLRRIASFGEKRRMCPGLTFKVPIPKGAKEKTEGMTQEQIERYIVTCADWPDPQAGAFQLLALYTGLRRGELQKLRWEDVDLDRDFVRLVAPKGSVDLTIPLSAVAVALLRDHPHDGDNPFVFAGAKGGPRGLRQIAESSRAIRDAAGLPKDFRPCHGLRHTFASHLASSGVVDLYTVQRLLGHKSPLMTQRYAHLKDETLRRAANVMRPAKSEGESA